MPTFGENNSFPWWAGTVVWVKIGPGPRKFRGGTLTRGKLTPIDSTLIQKTVSDVLEYLAAVQGFLFYNFFGVRVQVGKKKLCR